MIALLISVAGRRQEDRRREGAADWEAFCVNCTGLAVSHSAQGTFLEPFLDFP